MKKPPTPFAAFRAERGLPLAEVAEKFGVSKRTIIRWERGYTLIPVKHLEKVEAVTGIPRRELRTDLAGMFGGER